MFNVALKSLLLCATLALGAATASATVITFDDMEHNGNTEQLATYNGHSFTSDGYTFSSPIPGASSSFVSSSYTTYGFFGFHSDNGVYGAYANDGSDFLRLNLASVTMTSATNTPFTLNSVDVANWIAFVPDTVSLFGVRADGSVVSLLDLVLLSNTLGSDDFDTYVTSIFTNLTSLTFTSLDGNLAIDNINVTANVVTPTPPATNVPEPATLAIMGLGLVGIIVARRRKTAV